jgi:hypothetical protein
MGFQFPRKAGARLPREAAKRDDAELSRAAHFILDYPIYICIGVMF